MSAHTPGPWVASEYVGEPLHDGEACQRIDAKGPDISRPIALVWGDNAVWLTQDEKDANARLIAAAPDLLAACEAVLPDLQGSSGDEDFWARVATLRAAIAKAVGT